MDPATQRKLGRIGATIPKALTDRMVKRTVDTTEEDMAREILKKEDISPKSKRALQKAVDRGSLRQVSEEIDEGVVSQIDQHNAREVARMRASGELPDPNDDPYVRERNRKIAAKNGQPGHYSEFLKTLESVNTLKLRKNDVVIQLVESPAYVQNKLKFILVDEKPNNYAFGVVLKRSEKAYYEEVHEGQTVMFDVYNFHALEGFGKGIYLGSEKGMYAIFP